MDDPNVYRDLGTLAAKVGALELGQQAANTKLDVLLTRSEREQGGRAVLYRIAGFFGAVSGGVITALWEWWKSTRHA